MAQIRSANASSFESAWSPIIIAVHERELFQYLALELSPAFEGDELITMSLTHGRTVLGKK